MPLNGNWCFLRANQPPRRLLRLLVAVGLLALHIPALAATPFSLTVTPQESNDGVARLAWDAPENTAVYIQQSRTEDFQQPATLYRGNDSGTTITGLKDGSYFFRVAADGVSIDAFNWSDPVQLKVAHHTLVRAFTFFAVGVVVFMATLALVVSGSRRSKDSD